MLVHLISQEMPFFQNISCFYIILFYSTNVKSHPFQLRVHRTTNYQAYICFSYRTCHFSDGSQVLLFFIIVFLNFDLTYRNGTNEFIFLFCHHNFSGKPEIFLSSTPSNGLLDCDTNIHASLLLCWIMYLMPAIDWVYLAAVCQHK